MLPLSAQTARHEEMAAPWYAFDEENEHFLSLGEEIIIIYTGWRFLSCTLVALILSWDVPPSCWAGAVCSYSSSPLAPGSPEIGSSHQTKIKAEYLIQVI